MRASDESSNCKNNEYFSVKTSTNVIKQHNHNVYLSNHINHPHQYIDLFNLLRECTEEDIVTMYINNGGGYIKTTIQLIHAMRECKAKIITNADGFLASCATWIFLAGDEYMINKDIEFMCHYYSGGLYGKGNELEAHMDFSKKFYKKLFKRIYKDFMTGDEITELINGTDYYFNFKEVNRRLRIKVDARS
jgi:ATP-dependent protease ClpP protease subunit